MKPGILLIVHSLLLSLLIFTGCVSSPGSKLNQIAVGMTKFEVISIMGNPTSVSARDGVEILHYDLNASRAMLGTDFSSYFVRVVNGRVDSYGDAGELKQQTPQSQP